MITINGKIFHDKPGSCGSCVEITPYVSEHLSNSGRPLLVLSTGSRADD